jgi:DNA primase
MVLALDPDAAGDKATLRGLQIARQALDREDELGFDARGLLRHEARLQADIRVTTLPAGMDPDEVVNRDPQEWERILGNARPVVIYVMETLAAAYNLDDPKAKDEVAAQVLPLIEDVAGELERDTYRQRLARLLRVDERALLVGTPTRPIRNRRQGRRAPREEMPAERPQSFQMYGSSESIYKREAHALGLLLRRPDLLYKVDRNLQSFGLPRLTLDDFQHADHQTILRLLQESVDQDIAEPLHYVMVNLSLPMMEMADWLLERTGKLDPSEDKVLDDLLLTLLGLRNRSLHQNIEYFQFLMNDAQEQGDWKASQYQKTMVQHTLMLLRLNRALGQFTSRTPASR